MTFEKVLLVIPEHFKGVREHHTRPPVGMGYIAESLDQNNIDYRIVDLGLGNSPDIPPIVKEYGPDLIGVTSMTNEYKKVYELIKTILIFSDAPVIIGGPHGYAFNKRIFDECPVDYVVPGEGEEIITQLCLGKDREKIRGLYFKENNEVVFTGERKLIDFQNFPFPRYRNFEMDKYARFSKEITVQSSRGCPYNCIFCSSTQVFGKEFRAKTVENFVDEIEYWYNRGYKRIHICDDNFALVSKRVFEICDEIERRKIRISFIASNGIRADAIDKELLERMKDVGFEYIAIAVEGGNNKVLENLNKNESIETIREAIKTACDTGIGVGLYFLIGSPSETWNDFMDSVKIATEYPVASVQFFSLMPLPRTKLYDWVKENNYFIREPSEYLNSMTLQDDEPAFETPEMSRKERIKAIEYSRLVRKSINRRNRKWIPYIYGRVKSMVIK